MKAFGKLLGFLVTSIAVTVSTFTITYNYITSENEKGLATLEVIELKKSNITNIIKGEASIDGGSKANIPFPFQHEIEEVLVSVGDIVQEGDALVKLKTEELEAILEESKEQYSQLAASKDNVEQTLIQERDESQQILDSTKSSLSYQQQTLLELQQKLSSSSTDSFDIQSEELQNKLTQAEIKYSQGTELYNQGLLNEHELTELQQAVEMARFDYESHIDNYSGSGISEGEKSLIVQQLFNIEQEISKTQASIEVAEKKLSSAQNTLANLPKAIANKELQIKEFEAYLKDIELQIEESAIKTPISGRVTDINLDSLNSTKGLMNIESSSELVAKLLVEKKQAAMTGIGKEVYIQRDKNSSRVVGTILNMEDKIRDQVEITIKLPQNSGFKVGSKENIEVVLEEKDDVYAVPKSVIASTGYSGTICAVTPEKYLKEISVRKGIEEDGIIEISGVGINEDLKIVTEPEKCEIGKRVNTKTLKKIK